jgi:tetratricopeptide (TPR) repeat protein
LEAATQGFAAVRPPSLYPPGSRVDRYVVLSTVGKGGMGAVYAAYDSELDRRVALKFLLPSAAEATDSAGFQARLLLEARAMARLSHPNVVTLYQVGPAPDGGIYLAMELVDGGTLGAWLKAEKRSWREILAMLCQAGEGLAAAHRAGLIHRDFKLDNVLVRKDGRPQVTDFGVARGGDAPAHRERQDLPASVRPPADGPALARGPVPEPPLSSGSLSNLTLTGAMLGTPGYMAPEQYTMDANIDARADVFAFCATLYRALYGKRPFAGTSFQEVAEETLLGKVREPATGSDVPGWLRTVVLSGLEVDPNERPRSMDELLRALRADPSKRRRRWVIGAALVGVVCALSFGVHAAGDRRVRACRVEADRLRDAWDAPSKNAMAEAFRATNLTYAEDTWTHTEQRLDAYASEWTSAAYDVCAATRVRGEQSQAMRDLRNECLDQRLDELRAMTRIFKTADAKTVQNAVKLATGLPSLEPCSNLDRMSQFERLPEDAGARAEIRELRADVAEAAELRRAGRETLGRAEVDKIKERVGAAKSGSLLVAWALEAAQVESARDVKAAAEGWKRAFALADRYHLDRERAESEMELGGAYDDLGQHSDAEWWLGVASDTLVRIGGDPHLEVKRGSLLGLTYYQQGKYAEAVRVLRDAAERARKGAIDDPPALMNVHSFLAFALSKDDARLEEAITEGETSVAVAERAYGHEHPSVTKMLLNLGTIELVAGRYDDALGTISRVITTFERQIARGELVPPHVIYGVALSTRATILLRMGQPRDAVGLLERARSIDRQAGRRDYLLNDHVMLAEALRRLGRLEDAVQACAEGEAIADEDKETRAEDLVALRTVQGRVALDRGERVRALSFAERAVAGAETGVADAYDLATARLVLAQAIMRGHGDAARARALAEKARLGFAKLHDGPRVEEAAALLSESVSKSAANSVGGP